MRQTGGELAQGHELVALLLVLGGLADAVGHDADQSLAEHWNHLQHFGEQRFVKARRPKRGSHAYRARGVSHAGEGQLTSYLPGNRNHDGSILAGTLSLKANFPFEDKEHRIGGLAFTHDYFARRSMILL